MRIFTEEPVTTAILILTLWNSRQLYILNARQSATEARQSATEANVEFLFRNANLKPPKANSPTRSESPARVKNWIIRFTRIIARRSEPPAA